METLVDENTLHELIEILNNDDLESFIELDERCDVSKKVMPKGLTSNLATYISDGPPVISVAAYVPAVRIFDYLFENTNWKEDFFKEKGEEKDKASFPAKPILHYAITGGDGEIIQKLLGNGVDTKDMLMPILEKGRTDLAEQVINEYMKKNTELTPIDVFRDYLPHGVNPMKLAIKSRNIETVKLVANYYLEEKNTDFVIYDQRNGCALLTAVKTGDKEIFNFVRSINENQIGVLNKHKRNVFTQLIRKGNDDITSDFFDSISEYDDEVKQFLFNSKDDQGKTALHYAVKMCNKSFLEELIEDKNVDVAVQDNLMRTPVFDIVKVKNAEVLDLFLSNKKDSLNLSVCLDNYGRNPLHYVARDGWIQGLDIFVARCPELLNMKDASGLTPMMWAVINGNNDFVKHWIREYENDDYISYKIKDDFVTGSKRNALHWAIIEENYELTNLFIEKKWFDLDASPNDKTPSPNTLLESCRSKKMLDIVNGKFHYGDTTPGEEIPEQNPQTE